MSARSWCCYGRGITTAAARRMGGRPPGFVAQFGVRINGISPQSLAAEPREDSMGLEWGCPNSWTNRSCRQLGWLSGARSPNGSAVSAARSRGSTPDLKILPPNVLRLKARVGHGRSSPGGTRFSQGLIPSGTRVVMVPTACVANVFQGWSSRSGMGTSTIPPPLICPLPLRSQAA